MKKGMIRLISILLLFMMFFNTFSISFVEATLEKPSYESKKDMTEVNKEEDQGKTFGDVLGGIVDGLVGIFTWFGRVLIILLGGAVNTILSGTVNLAGANDVSSGFYLTPDKILFNQLNLTDINFFEATSSSTNHILHDLRHIVASWYNALRTFAVVALLVVLIYVAIRMTLSTIAGEQAKYKAMLVDWLQSFALLFVLHYIIIITISFNNAVVSLLANIRVTDESALMEGFTSELVARALSPMATIGWGATIMYIMMIGITLTFLLIYIKRLFTVGFLILIAPLITVTYSIDKISDGKSQALNTWFKEFIYNVIVQPFHCLLYLIFATASLNLLNGTLGGMVLAILALRFIWKGEEIVKKIFGIESNQLMGGIAAAAMVGGAISKVGNMAAGAAGKAGKSGGDSEESSSDDSDNSVPAVKPAEKELPKADGEADKRSSRTGAGGTRRTGGARGSGGRTYARPKKKKSMPASTPPIEAPVEAPVEAETPVKPRSRLGSAMDKVKSTKTFKTAKSTADKVYNSKPLGTARALRDKMYQVPVLGSAFKKANFLDENGAKNMGRIAGAAVGLGVNGGIIEPLLGGSFGSKVGEGYDNRRATKNQEKITARDYDDLYNYIFGKLKASGIGANDEERGKIAKGRMKEISTKVMKMSTTQIESISDEKIYKYASQLHTLSGAYKKEGKNGPKEVEKTLGLVAQGKIKPKTKI